MGYKENYESWLNNPYFDEDTRNELKSIEGNEKEIEDRFYMDLEFGTAGLRGVIGAGTNRMNIYTVRKATQGLANYISRVNGQKRGVAIAYDSRHMSPEFADEAALCLAANGIKAYVFESLRPTPELSYAVRKLGCIAGINVTASHNPPEYNGYKVYWEDGAQITPPHDTGIMDEVKKVTDYAAVKTMPLDEAKAAGLYQVIGADIDDPYIAELKKLVLHQDCIDKVGGELKIVYTPLHGTGNIPVRRVLKELGFKNVYVVPEQELPDGDFPTVSYPNPEAAEAFELGLALGKKVDADLILATDPDADRLGVYVKDSKTGEYHSLTGNMSGCLIGDYVIGQRRERDGSLPADGAFIRSIVSTNMADAIADYYGIELVEVLTGFKFIGEQIGFLEKEGQDDRYIFGFEESYGYLAGSYVRDKDAVVGSMLICEMAAFYRTKGISLLQAREDMYKKYGNYLHSQKSFQCEGASGMERMKEIMTDLRADPPKAIGGLKVIDIADYLASEETNLETGVKTVLTLPKSDVIAFKLEQGASVIIRPSGTEPKIKAYYTTIGDTRADAEAQEEKLIEDFKGILGF